MVAVMQATLLLSLAAAGGSLVYGWHRLRLRSIVLDRLIADSSERGRNRERRIASSPLTRFFRFVPYAFGPTVGILLWLFVGVPWIYCFAGGMILVLVGTQLESWLADRKKARLEGQLADAIDIMVGALGAGAGLSMALQAAARESSAPLKQELQNVLARIQLGDNAAAVFRDLSDRIPLETFLLFSTSLSAQWEAGGSLGPVLASVGRTIRDRIEISRRIRSNSAQSHISTIVILLITYFIALIGWANAPDQMESFLRTSIGSFFVAGTMIMQAVGIVWMSYVSRLRF